VQYSAIAILHYYLSTAFVDFSRKDHMGNQCYRA